LSSKTAGRSFKELYTLLSQKYLNHYEKEEYDIKRGILELWEDMEETLKQYRSSFPLIRAVHDALFQVLKGELDQEVFLQELINYKNRLYSLKFSEPLTPKQINFNFLVDMVYWWLDLFIQFIYYRDLSVLALAVVLEESLGELISLAYQNSFLEKVKLIQSIVEEYSQWRKGGNQQ